MLSQTQKTNPVADELIEQLRISLDPDRRAETYHSFHRLLDSEQPYTFFVYTERTAKRLTDNFFDASQDDSFSATKLNKSEQGTSERMDFRVRWKQFGSSRTTR